MLNFNLDVNYHFQSEISLSNQNLASKIKSHCQSLIKLSMLNVTLNVKLHF